MKPISPIAKSAHQPRASEKKFGFFFALVFLALGIYEVFLARDENFIYVWFFLSITFACITVFLPHLLIPLNAIWMSLGELLGRFVSPIILGVIFFGLLSPIAVVTRLFGRDELRLRGQSVESYWVDRVPSDPISNFFHQF